jgi:hypothetical protein
MSDVKVEIALQKTVEDLHVARRRVEKLEVRERVLRDDLERLRRKRAVERAITEAIPDWPICGVVDETKE